MGLLDRDTAGQEQHNGQGATQMAGKRNNDNEADVVIAAGGDLVIGSIGGIGHRVVIDGPVHGDSFHIGSGGVFVGGERINGHDNGGN